MSVSDAERSGYHFEVSTAKISNEIHEMVMGDRRFKLRMIDSA